MPVAPAWRGVLVTPAEAGWIIQHDAADATSGSLQSADPTSGSLREHCLPGRGYPLQFLLFSTGKPVKNVVRKSWECNAVWAKELKTQKSY